MKVNGLDHLLHLYHGHSVRPPADWGAQLPVAEGRTWHAWDVVRTMWAVQVELLQVNQRFRGIDREPGCLAQEYTAKLGALQAKG